MLDSMDVSTLHGDGISDAPADSNQAGAGTPESNREIKSVPVRPRRTSRVDYSLALHSAMTNSLERGMAKSKVAQRPSGDHQG